MLAADFPQKTKVLGKPNNMTDEQCYGLPVHETKNEDGRSILWSRWRPSYEDMQEISRTGDIWVQTIGETLAPFSLHAENPFLPQEAGRAEPVVGAPIEDVVESVQFYATRDNIPYDFFFNGVTLRIYPGDKVPVEAYVDYYKLKAQILIMEDRISAANA